MLLQFLPGLSTNLTVSLQIILGLKFLNGPFTSGADFAIYFPIIKAGVLQGLLNLFLGWFNKRIPRILNSSVFNLRLNLKPAHGCRRNLNRLGFNYQILILS